MAAPRFSNVHALLREQVAQQQERAQQQFLQSYQTPHAFTQSGGGGGGDRWVEVLRPAIAWLFGFVDTQMAMTEGSASAEILDEHRRALDEVSRQVGSVLSSSPDSGLSASLWRATVSLLTHFAERAAPMMGQLRELQKDVAAARVLDAKHAVERASWERERAELRAAIASGGAPEGFRRGSIASRRRSSVSALRQQQQQQQRQQQAGTSSVRFGDGELLADFAKAHAPLLRSASDLSSPRSPPSPTAPSPIGEGEGEEEDADEMVAELERMNAELHEQIVACRSELVTERHRNATLQNEVTAAREKLHARAALSRIQSVSLGGSAVASSGGGGGGGGRQRGGGSRARGARRSRGQHHSGGSDDDASSDDDRDDEEGDDEYDDGRSHEQLEAELDDTKKQLLRLHELFEAEAKKRESLEAFRGEMARRFSQSFVVQIEREQQKLNERAALTSAAAEAARGDIEHLRRPSTFAVGSGGRIRRKSNVVGFR